MRAYALLVPSILLSGVLAEIPFLNEPDTGFDLSAIFSGTLPALADVKGFPDFEAAARRYMNVSSYCGFVSFGRFSGYIVWLMEEKHITGQEQRGNLVCSASLIPACTQHADEK